MSKKTSIYLSADLSAKLRCPPRGQSAAVSSTIDRYYALISPERKRLEAIFSEAEWNAMRNACNGTAWDASSIRGGVLADIEDSLDDDITRFGATRAVLEDKLRSLSPVQQYALVEMIESFWEGVSPADKEPDE